MFIEILYSDLSRKKVPISDIDELKKTGVLAIIISAPDDIRPRLNGSRRVAEATGKDFYYIVENNGFIGLDSRDEFERLTLFDKKKPWLECGSFMIHPQYTGKMTIFEGKAIPDDEWKKALELFNREMH